MNILKYIQFFPLLIKLVEFIRDAESRWTQPGSGTEKLSYVVSKFLPVVEQAVAVGLIPQKLGEVLTSGAPAIISVIVQVMKAVDVLHGGKSGNTGNTGEGQPGGLKPAPTPTQPPADPTTVEYDDFATAKTHVSAGYPYVIEKPNGKFIVYPFGTGVLPGTVVYPV